MKAIKSLTDIYLSFGLDSLLFHTLEFGLAASRIEIPETEGYVPCATGLQSRQSWGLNLRDFP
jgi:hypothetical protein